MRTALRGKGASRSQTSSIDSYAAPVGGWNARDSLANMQHTDAITLENWFPRSSYVEFRGGSASHATGMTGIAKTLASYNALTGTHELFAFTDSGTYDVSAAGAVGASVLARTNSKHQVNLFGDGTYNYLIACNGVDKPAYYNGTTWTAVDSLSTPALTGVTTTALIASMTFKGRLIFLANDSLSFYYLAAGSAGGALTAFDLSGEFTRGGYLMACATWTRDSGRGADDYAVFITSEGEAAVYQGTNPNSAATWAKVGSYSIGRPLGRRCLAQYGGDCVVITESGVYPLSALLANGDEERSKFAMSYKIQSAMSEAARSYGTLYGWKIIVFPKQDAMLVNIPVLEEEEQKQYVMNTVTKAWCNFTKWNAEDFAVFDGELYFSNGTAVYKAWTGTDDEGANITFYGKQAFSDFGTPKTKQCKMFMPILAVTGDITYLSDVDIDFEDGNIAASAPYTASAGSTWDVALWDFAYWSSTTRVIKRWSSPSEYTGRFLAGKIKIETQLLTGQWIGSTMMYEVVDSIG